MACVVCARACRSHLCGPCRSDLRSGGERLIGGRLLARSALLHRGTARLLVHRLKYQGLVAAAGPLAEMMAPLVDPGAPGLVPVPRTVLRRWRHGVDPGLELARALARLVGVPVLRALRPGWWHRRRAGAAGSPRGVPGFGVLGEVPAGSLLVDDVVTTGMTLWVAARELGRVGGAVTATGAPSGLGAWAEPGGRAGLTPQGSGAGATRRAGKDAC